MSLTDKIKLLPGDCLDVLATLADNSIDSCVTDPPYHLTSIVKRFGQPNSAPINNADEKMGRNGPYQRASSGFMGKQWDGGDIAFRPETWAEVYRVLKPGAHLLAFGGTRTYHRMACAIEDAGFEIRDCIQWLYGSGFPKSHDVSKGIDRAAGAERERIGTKVELGVIHAQGEANKTMHEGWQRPWRDDPNADAHWVTIPATDAARQWEGWGTALKPACELIVLARKPLSEGTVAANVLKWGTGAINVDECRVGIESRTNPIMGKRFDAEHGGRDMDNFKRWQEQQTETIVNGRWPANVIHDGSDEVVAGFPETVTNATGSNPQMGNIGYGSNRGKIAFESYPTDTGSAARFFYTAKADDVDRIGSKHPTVKPLDLMQYLVRLVTPKGGTVLDMFAGSGTTGEAAFREGMKAILIEREAEYLKDIARRMELCMAGPVERQHASMKAKLEGKPRDDGPLFGGTDDWDSMWQKPFDKPELL